MGRLVRYECSASPGIAFDANDALSEFCGNHWSSSNRATNFTFSFPRQTRDIELGCGYLYAILQSGSIQFGLER
jgi:hypothetical protein